jgi:Domain of unknown function (DUF4397)
MPKFFKSLAVLLALPLVLAGCKVNSINYFPPKPAHFRVVNVLGAALPIDVSVNGTVVWSNLAFEGMTGYVEFENSSTDVSVSLSGSGAFLVDQTYNPAGNESYTLVVYGTIFAPTLGVMADVTQAPPSGQFALNFFNAAPTGNAVNIGLYPIDIYITKPGQVIDNLSPNFSFIQYTNTNLFTQMGAGDYELRFTIAGTKTNIYDSGTLTFSDQTATDVIIYSKGSTVLTNVLLDDSDGAARQVVANNLLTRIRAMNAAFQTGPVNELVNDVPLNSALAFTTASPYNTIPAGPAVVTFEAASAPGAPIATLNTTLLPAVDQTVFVTGFAGATTAVGLIDNNLPPAGGTASVRFVNASPNSNPLDVYVGDVKEVPALATNAASAYASISANLYVVSFKDSVTGETVLSMPNTGFNSGQTYTIYVLGPAGALGGSQVADTP